MWGSFAINLVNGWFWGLGYIFDFFYMVVNFCVSKLHQMI